MIRQLTTAAVLAAGVLGVAVGSAAAQPAPILPVPPQNDQGWKLGVLLTANPGGGLYIRNVFPYSPAEAIGLRPGMVILTIDGVLYNDPTQARDKILFQSGDSISVVYQDGAQFFQVTADLVGTPAVAAIAAPPAPGMPAPAAGAQPVKKVVPKAKNIKRVPVADPRKKK